MAEVRRTVRFGGSFAPPLDAEKLSRYRELAESASVKIREGMLTLCNMLDEFWKTGKSSLPGRKHPSGVGTVIPLEDAEIKRIDHAVPWREELNIFSEWFADLPAGEVRDAAHHLLWYGYELTNDREPITTDTL